MTMGRWTGRLVILGAIFLFAGWGLVLASGHGGNSSGGSAAVWTVGGLMVYAAFPVLVLAAASEFMARLGQRRRSSGSPP